jgi:hypothetical protein
LNLLQKVNKPDETVVEPHEFKHEKTERKAKKSKPSKSEITSADVAKMLLQENRKENQEKQ